MKLIELTAKTRRGQSLMEYTVIIAIVVGALVVMRVYMKRGIQSAIKAAADQLAPQATSDIFNLEKGGYLESSNSFTHEIDIKNIITRPYLGPPMGMDMKTTYNRTTDTQSNEVYFQGEYEEE